MAIAQIRKTYLMANFNGEIIPYLSNLVKIIEVGMNINLLSSLGIFR